MKKGIIILLFLLLAHYGYSQTKPSTQTTTPTTQPLPAVPPGQAAPEIPNPAPSPQVPVQSLPATDPNDLNKSNTANPALLQPPIDSTSSPINTDSVPRKRN